MGEQYAWMILFPIVLPTLFAVAKLAWDERRRHKDVCHRLSHLEERMAEQRDMLEQMRIRR